MKGRKDRKGLQIFDEIVAYCENSDNAPTELSRGQFITKVSSQRWLVMGRYGVNAVRSNPDIFDCFATSSVPKVPYAIFRYEGGK